MATPLEAIQQVAEQTLGFYAFTFADEIADADIEPVAQWAQDNNRMFITVVADLEEAKTAGESFKGTNLYHHCITYHQDYNSVGAIAGMGLDQRYNATDGVKTLHLKTLYGVKPSDITQTEANELTAAGVNFYSNYGNIDSNLAVFTNGFAGDGKYFDFVMGIDWLKNTIETTVFNGQRNRRSTPQTRKGVMMIKNDIISACDTAVNAGLIGPGQWNGPSVGDVETYDYLTNGYYVHSEPLESQAQEERERRQSPLFTVLAKGAGAFHNIDIMLIPQQ